MTNGEIANWEYMIDMESEIIREIKQILEFELPERQRKYYEWLLSEAKPVKVVRAVDVLEDYELDYIRHVLKPQKKECYRNAHILCEAFQDRFLYCEGRVNVPFPIDHAFNKVGDVYIDITFEFALGEDPGIYEYVTFGEYDAKTIQQSIRQTRYYGEVLRWMYANSLK